MAISQLERNDVAMKVIKVALASKSEEVFDAKSNLKDDYLNLAKNCVAISAIFLPLKQTNSFGRLDFNLLASACLLFFLQPDKWVFPSGTIIFLL